MPIRHDLGNKFAHRLWVVHQNSLWIAFAADEAQIRGKTPPLLALTRNEYSLQSRPQTRMAAFLAGFLLDGRRAQKAVPFQVPPA
jgi:hypothetical protein